MHELGHQWFGNYVTPARWRDVWLSEGLTTFLERAIVADSFGPKERERAEQTTQQRGIFLRKTITRLRRQRRGNVACLCCELVGLEDPDKVLTESDYLVPYEKGFLLLSQLQKLVGKEKIWEFLRRYLKAFAGKNASSEDFVALWEKEFPTKTVDWSGWLYESSLPVCEAR